MEVSYIGGLDMLKKLIICILFITLCFVGGTLFLYHHYSTSLKQNLNQASNQPESNYKTAYKGSGVEDVLSEKVLNRYKAEFLEADDEYDYQYANDYAYDYLIKTYRARDCSAYEKILGYHDVSLNQIQKALQLNQHISHIYKDFIYEFACDLRKYYPNCNLAVLYHNLQTLLIEEMSQEQINLETLSTDSAACYLRYENKICIKEGINLNRDSDDYIILIHELCHAARSLQQKKDEYHDYKIDIGFYNNYKMGHYAEESIITNIAYELQGLNKRATFYPLLASYYRIISDCIGYSGEDFFLHSVNYLIDQMDAFMETKEAYQIVARIDAQMTLRYTPYAIVDFKDYQPIYDYIARMYFKKHINSQMSYQQAEAVFEAFYEDITFNFENMDRLYDITKETFLPTFYQHLKEIGITS